MRDRIFRLLRSHDLRAAKTAFIPSFVDELKEQSGPEVTYLIEEAENVLVDRQGWVLLEVFPTGGNFNDTPDGLMRLQSGYAGSRMSHVLVQASRYLADTHQLFQDRVRHPQHDEKGAPPPPPGTREKVRVSRLEEKAKVERERPRVHSPKWQQHRLVAQPSRRY